MGKKKKICLHLFSEQVQPRPCPKRGFGESSPLPGSLVRGVFTNIGFCGFPEENKAYRERERERETLGVPPSARQSPPL